MHHKSKATKRGEGIGKQREPGKRRRDAVGKAHGSGERRALDRRTSGGVRLDLGLR